jgi:hypothetical protein
MTTQQTTPPVLRSKFSNSTYRDFVECSPLHFNSMRADPVLPQAFIENNLVHVRPFPQNWLPSSRLQDAEANPIRSKRCLFSRYQIHLASLSSLTNGHLMSGEGGGDSAYFSPSKVEDDHLRREIGARRRVENRRNGLEAKSGGDKSYRDVEYSREFFNKSEREWRSRKFELHGRKDETIPTYLMQIMPENTINFRLGVNLLLFFRILGIYIFDIS